MSRDINSYASAYALDYGFERHQVAFRRRSVLKRCAANQAKHVLEIGCGLEPLFIDYPPVSSWYIVEPASMFAESAKKLALENVHGCVVVIQDFLESALNILKETHANHPFDLIIASGVLQEVSDPQSFLAGIHSLCTPSTTVQIDVSNAHSLHRRTAVEMGLLDAPSELSARGKVLQQRIVYDKKSLHAELMGAGFQIKNHGGIFMKPFDHARMDLALETGILTIEHLYAYENLGDQFPDLASELWVEITIADHI
ncbi:class I SAM-dependent methyltransferase [Synechococcus sp. CS-1324]|uniref:class I SAM-dependent methyltransferase n=1 Tax=Synechococcus sp. CS-1324 TaxID=2847980 RepID=UPI00223B7094|nr:class I SAM-dependent methyltransferase [Synechococcus sp. CS-1324]MCT0231705.1 class I SAM-dependent methyltransferase [Synechococcus sp. CS-1324]